MKVSEVQENPDDPNSDWIISFEFDDTEDDQNLLRILTSAAKANQMSVEDYMIQIITENAKRTIAEAKPKKKTKKKAKKK